MQETFQKAQATLVEEVSNLHEKMNKCSEAKDKKTEEINDKIMRLIVMNSVIMKDILELGHELLFDLSPF